MELDPAVRSDDPAFDTLKRLLLRHIAEIEKPKEEEPSIAAVPEAVE
jgi:hypothetical protein